jgi:hypothetical protein
MAKANSKRIGYSSFGIGVDRKYDAGGFFISGVPGGDSSWSLG